MQYSAWDHPTEWTSPPPDNKDWSSCKAPQLYHLARETHGRTPPESRASRSVPSHSEASNETPPISQNQPSPAEGPPQHPIYDHLALAPTSPAVYQVDNANHAKPLW